MSDAELAQQDIAQMNLRCAEGFEQVTEPDIQKCLRQLDGWANHVRHETDRYLPTFHAQPEKYKNSEGYFRILTLITVLQKDLGVHYNQERIRQVDFRKPHDLFIHGMIGNDNGGTCVSMPVIYTAVARRLGYPVRLVNAKAHLFCRWDGHGERFNIEGTGQGFTMHSDKHYQKWPYPISAGEIAAGHFLRSLSPREELAVFLAARGHCLRDNRHTSDAMLAYAQANRLAPSFPAYLGFLYQTVRQAAAPKDAAKAKQLQRQLADLQLQEHRMRAQYDQLRHQWQSRTGANAWNHGHSTPTHHQPFLPGTWPHPPGQGSPWPAPTSSPPGFPLPVPAPHFSPY